jgi:hypothetical protein
MTVNPPKMKLRFRTVLISDAHLGFRGCSAEYLLAGCGLSSDRAD